MAVGTWTYVNWLTHAKNAVRMDAKIGLKSVEHLLGTFTAARLRLAKTRTRCETCGSYRVAAGTCEHCGWVDPYHEPTVVPPIDEADRARRLDEPCAPSSDISTFIAPTDFL
jgi:ribosomal protein L32